MMEHARLIEALARAATLALVSGVVESAVLAVVVAVAIGCTRTSATTRHVLWWMVLWAGAVLPVISFAVSVRHVEHRVAVQDSAPEREARGELMTIDMTIAPALAHHAVAPLLPIESHAGGGGASAAWSAVTSMPYAATGLIAVWLAVSAAALAALARSAAALRRIKRAALPLDESVMRRLRRFRHGTRAGRPVAVGVSDEIDVPVAIGFRTPIILLPSRVVELEEIADIDQIAMHEYAHLNRYDDWTNLAQRFLERTFWFNPIMAVAGRRISLEREIACDDWVIAQTGRAHRYATCLWKLVESTRFPTVPIVAPGALLTARQITIRIERLLDSRRNALPRLSPLGAMAGGALCAALAVVAIVRAPAVAIVDFVPANPVIVTRAIPPASAPSPRPAPNAYLFVRKDVRVVAGASPEAVASAVAAAVSASQGAAVKTTVATALHGARAAARMVAAISAAPVVAGNRVDRAIIARCTGCDFRGRDLKGSDLHGLTLTAADFHGADLRGANLRGTSFVGANLTNVRLDGADLRDASFTACDLRGTDVTRALLDGARVIGTSIRGVTVTGTRLRSLIDGCAGCDLRGLDLHGQDLRGITILGADLRDADLHAADLRGAHLEAVDLRGANVRGLRLDGATLVHCDVTGLDFSLRVERGAKHPA